ncbi:outer membrane lipoprotein-sorting protein [Methylococcus sp. EFPC2]|nr:outer membrane lipoprotein-sorting protein [Methylococcus sp. EFPC2]
MALMLGAIFIHPAAAEDPVELVTKADHIRFPATDFQVKVVITTTSADSQPDVHEYQVLSKGNENTIVHTTEPASDRGQILLMKGRDLWVFMPSVSQPVRLPLSQRLTGQVANGDMARANFTGDYTPTLLRTDTINNTSYHVLELNAVDRTVTYHRVLYWIDKTSYRPFKAEFYSLSNHLIKTAHYRNFKQMEGEIRPTELLLIDALSNEQSLLVYSDMKRRELPDKIFTKDYLKKLE